MRDVDRHSPGDGRVDVPGHGYVATDVAASSQCGGSDLELVALNRQRDVSLGGVDREHGFLKPGSIARELQQDSILEHAEETSPRTE